ncbi:MAG: helix-turn-helix domain-containing protein [Actinomycetota bacterium]|nr:helix-turn-helix domain-containing protein [Actinomycetota bacterium]
MDQTPGQLLRDTRKRHGLSQKRLAARASTTQSAISRIERDQVSPSVATLRSLLHLMGEDLVLGIEPRDFGIDRAMARTNLRKPVEERVRKGREFSAFVVRNRGLLHRKETV